LHELAVEVLDQALECELHVVESLVHLLRRVVAPLSLAVGVALGERGLRLLLQVA
jgi:hypothetical protein